MIKLLLLLRLELEVIVQVFSRLFHLRLNRRETFVLLSPLVADLDLVYNDLLKQVGCKGIAHYNHQRPVSEAAWNYFKLEGIKQLQSTYKEHVLDPLDLVEHDKEEGKEDVSKCKEHEQVVVIHGLSEWMANTE